MFFLLVTKQEMEVLVNSDGTRNRDFRPYIDQEEWKRNLILYDPNGQRLENTGLYDRTRPACERWVDHFHRFETRFHAPPGFRVDVDGRTTRYATGPRSPHNFMSYH